MTGRRQETIGAALGTLQGNGLRDCAAVLREALRIHASCRWTDPNRDPFGNGN